MPYSHVFLLQTDLTNAVLSIGLKPCQSTGRTAQETPNRCQVPDT
jgi:hypothetical protein